MSRGLIIVSGGVADYVADPGVEVEVFDWDNYNDDPNDTPPVPAHFADLAEMCGVPAVEQVTVALSFDQLEELLLACAHVDWENNDFTTAVGKLRSAAATGGAGND